MGRILQIDSSTLAALDFLIAREFAAVARQRSRHQQFLGRTRAGKKPLDEDEEIFTEIPLNSAVQRFLDGVLRVRRDLYIDPRLGEPWSCEPDRCRPLLGRNLCCKVEVRCSYLDNERCAIQTEKPFSCALFPLDLVRVGGVRIVTTVANPDFFLTGWSRFDRDMLRCFDGKPPGRCSMFDAQRDVLKKVLTQSEITLMQRRIETLAAESPAQCR